MVAGGVFLGWLLRQAQHIRSGFWWIDTSTSTAFFGGSCYRFQGGKQRFKKFWFVGWPAGFFNGLFVCVGVGRGVQAAGLFNIVLL
jgi:hypothetical protein